MNWFVAKIVFVTGGLDEQTFDEQIRLVEADSEEEALSKARALGIGEEDFGSKITEQYRGFVDVLDLQPLLLGNGASLHSITYQEKEPKAYINFVHQKGLALRLKARPGF